MSEQKLKLYRVKGSFGFAGTDFEDEVWAESSQEALAHTYESMSERLSCWIDEEIEE